jgi:transcriptional regulator with XRE-family HTH domain
VDQSQRVAIGARLRAFRREARLSSADLAQQMGLSHSAIARVERGEGSPTAALLLHLAVEIGASLQWLLVGEGPMRWADVLSSPDPAALAKVEAAVNEALPEHLPEDPADVRRIVEALVSMERERNQHDPSWGTASLDARRAVSRAGRSLRALVSAQHLMQEALDSMLRLQTDQMLGAIGGVLPIPLADLEKVLRVYAQDDPDRIAILQRVLDSLVVEASPPMGPE